MTWDIQYLFRRHAKGIKRSLQRRGLSEETAADIAQDTFLRVLTAQPSGKTSNHNPQAYLYQISRNLCINHLKRECLVDFVDIHDDSLPEIADPLPLADTVVYDREMLKRTEAALAELPVRTRHAFELHRLHEMTISEVAKQTGLSTTRTWALIREAYHHLIMRTGGL